MAISIAAPNPDNYVVGKGRVYFKPEGAGGDILDYPVGNVTEWELTPNVETLPHFSSMAGVRTKDKEIVLERGYAVRMVMEEWVPANMRLMLAGEPDTSDLTEVTIEIGSESNVTGQMRFVGTNDVGPKWTFDLPEVQFNPTGSLNPISDEWGGMEVTGEVLADEDGIFGTAVSDFSVGAAVPTNTIPPTIYGTAQVGQTLTALKGTWTGAPTSYAYQWEVDDGGGYDPIGGATNSTYVPVIGQIGFPIRVKVTATNIVGPNSPDTVRSPPTADVIAA